MNSIFNDNFLYFDEGPHKYTDTYGNEYISVTTIIGNYSPKFDKDYWLHKKAKELGITEKELAKRWQDITDEACTRGSHTHNGLEDGIKGSSMFKDAIKYLNQVETGRCITVADIPNLKARPLDIEKFKEATNNKYPKIYEVFDFYITRGYTIYSEIGVFLPNLLISGTIDVLAIKSDRFVILDWKTNKDGLHFTSGYYKKDKICKPVQLTNNWIEKDEKMLPPFNTLPECNGSHYTIQLSTYARMVELILGIPCVGCGLCHIGTPFKLNQYGMPYRDEKGLYEIDKNGEETVQWYRIDYIRDMIDAMFRDRRIYLNSKGLLNKQTTLFNENDF
nr:MAG TPA: Exonuclease V [Crassvirales sp.]